jgi:hypothetical protein
MPPIAESASTGSYEVSRSERLRHSLILIQKFNHVRQGFMKQRDLSELSQIHMLYKYNEYPKARRISLVCCMVVL